MLTVDERVGRGLALDFSEGLEAFGKVLGAREIAAEIEEAAIGLETLRIEFLHAAAHAAESPDRGSIDLGERFVPEPATTVGESRGPILDGGGEGEVVDLEILIESLEIHPDTERMEVVAAPRQGDEAPETGRLPASRHGRSAKGGDIAVLFRCGE